MEKPIEPKAEDFATMEEYYDALSFYEWQMGEYEKVSEDYNEE